MTDDNADDVTTPAEPTATAETPAETPPVDEARAAETPTETAPAGDSADETPPLPATAAPPADELIAEADAQAEYTAEHAEPPEEQPEEAPAGAVPPDDAATAEPEAKPKKPRKSAKPVVADATEPAAEPPEAEPVPVDAAVAAAVAESPPESKKRWYAIKVQSGREESIKAAIERKIKIEGLEEFFGQLVIPVEEVVVKKKVKVKNKKTGETTTQEKNVTKYNKKFQGYLFAEVEFNDEILYVFRETSGVGDFVGMNMKKTAGGGMSRQPPPPMTDDEVKSMLTGAPTPGGPRKGKGGKVVVKLDFEKGDKVRIRNGAFTGSEGEVKSITEPKDPTETPKITVEVTLWGRPVPVEVDYWEVDKV